MIVTYLGHQGWSFTSATGHVFLDPVFRTIGNAGVQLPLWPDREISTESLGPVAGIILSHEHSDHFDIDTLYRMPWRGRIYVSSRSSRAMTDLLADIGYQVTRIRPYEVLRFPGLQLTVLPLEWSPLEPDAYGFLAEGDDATSFFTSVDGMPHAEAVRWLKENCPKRSVDNFTNNYMEPLPELTGLSGLDRYATGDLTVKMVEGVEKLTPSRVVLSGQGWSYPPSYSALNHRFFNVTHQRMLPVLAEIYPHIRWEAPEPGTRIGLAGEPEDGTIAPFVTSRVPANRDYRGYMDAMEGKPWSGLSVLPDREMRKVLGFVSEKFGQMINAHASELMKQLFTLSAREDNCVLPTIALRLRDGSGSRHFLLDQGWLEFIPAPEEIDIRLGVAAGIEVWASDLLLMIEGREEPYLIYETAVRRWSNVQESIRNSLHIHAFMSFGPRLQPDAFAVSYRRRLAEVRQATPEAPELDVMEGSAR